MGAEMNAKILIVDDHAIVREGIRTLLTRLRPEWEIVGEAASGLEALAAIPTLDPDVVIMDITMPGMSGLEASTRVSKAGSHSKILMFTMHDAPSLKDEVRAAGAQGFVLKSQGTRDLVTAIEKLLAGGTFYGAPSMSAEDDGNGKKGGALLRLALRLSPAF